MQIIIFNNSIFILDVIFVGAVLEKKIAWEAFWLFFPESKSYNSW